MQSLYPLRRKGSAAPAAFSFPAVDHRYNPCSAGRSGTPLRIARMCNHYTTPQSHPKYPIIRMCKAGFAGDPAIEYKVRKPGSNISKTYSARRDGWHRLLYSNLVIPANPDLSFLSHPKDGDQQQYQCACRHAQEGNIHPVHQCAISVYLCRACAHCCHDSYKQR